MDDGTDGWKGRPPPSQPDKTKDIIYKDIGPSEKDREAPTLGTPRCHLISLIFANKFYSALKMVKPFLSTPRADDDDTLPKYLPSRSVMYFNIFPLACCDRNSFSLIIKFYQVVVCVQSHLSQI